VNVESGAFARMCIHRSELDHGARTHLIVARSGSLGSRVPESSRRIPARAGVTGTDGDTLKPEVEWSSRVYSPNGTTPREMVASAQFERSTATEGSL
jgi:hypothetical protein